MTRSPQPKNLRWADVRRHDHHAVADERVPVWQ